MNREKTIYGEYFHYPAATDWEKIAARPHLDTQQLAEVVKDVLADIKANGDEAVRKYESKFDHVELDSLKVRADEINEADGLIDDELKNSLLTAYHNIYTFHESQRFQSHHVETCPGVDCWQKSMPIEKVGLYIPGGTAPLFSTVLMLATPAKIAGCKDLNL